MFIGLEQSNFYALHVNFLCFLAFLAKRMLVKTLFYVFIILQLNFISGINVKFHLSLVRSCVFEKYIFLSIMVFVLWT